MGECAAEDLTSPGKHLLPNSWLVIILVRVILDVSWQLGVYIRIESGSSSTKFYTHLIVLLISSSLVTYG